ncbi:MAG: hypothetical protein ACKOPE_14050 [Novosphingobium sp.]
MLRRLLACLLIFCLAAPALAVAPHCLPKADTGSSAAATGSHHGHHKPVKPEHSPTQSIAHECIGCIAPYSSGLRLTAEAPLFGAEPLAAITDQLRGLAHRPALPPPRV